MLRFWKVCNDLIFLVSKSKHFLTFYTQYIVDMCQYWLNTSAGYLTTPYVYYSNNLDCTWMINGQEGFYINLEIDYFMLNSGDNLFVYDVHDDTEIKIAELDFTSNFQDHFKKTISSIVNHSLLIHFSADHESVHKGFSAYIHHIPKHTTCAEFIEKTEFILTNAIDCTNWIITAPFATSKIDITFQNFEVARQ